MSDDPQGIAPPTAPAPSPRWLNRTVAGAGITSALGDFCYETTTVILPGFLAVLGVPAAALGIIEGIADAIASFTKMVSGYIADRLGHRKALVLAGYALTPLGQLFIALAAGWPLLLLGRLVSWFGKGLRGPLRDAIVVQAVDARTRGRAFGFHRAMDTIGAVLGLPARFRRYLRAVGLFGLGDFSHSLLILAATQLLTPAMGLLRATQVAGLLYVGRYIVQVLASYPVGAWADRIGSLPLLVAGYALGTATAVLAALAFCPGAASLPLLVAIFVIAGLYVAVQEALESTVTADMVAPDTLAMSYGALGTVNGAAKFLSSAVVGLLWSAVSPVLGFCLAAVAMLAGTLALKRLNR